MEVINSISYKNLLLQLLETPENTDKNLLINNKSLELNFYLTLMALNKNNYNENIYNNEHNIIDDFLRKINNLKIKIQLKRKEEEVNKLAKEIKEIYQNNINIISKFNKENLDIEQVVSSKEPKELTNLIDKLTKIKIQKNDLKEEHDKIRTQLLETSFNNKYIIENNIIHIDLGDNKIKLPLEVFYELFEYLLDIDNYPQPFTTTKSNRERTIMIGEIIKLAITKEKTPEDLSKIIIPLTITNLLSQEITNFDNIDTSFFKIDNIKITELYSFASNNNQIDTEHHAKWNKIVIPNEYLYTKIKELVSKGMYYFQNDKFILESIDNNICDFKVSININDMKTFLVSNLRELVQIETNTKKRAK